MWAFFTAGMLKWVVAGGVVIAAIGGLYLKGHRDGTVACELKQQKQMAKVEAYVKRIRERVERNEPLDPDLLRPDNFKRDD